MDAAAVAILQAMRVLLLSDIEKQGCEVSCSHVFIQD
jgi:hypothetical protein